MTEERLNELCGGAPPYGPSCPLCPRRVGPYYSSALARDALAEHMRWQHGYAWNAGQLSAASATRRAAKGHIT